MKTPMRTFLLVEVLHVKPIPDLTDLVAGRAYTLDGVEGVEARLLAGGEFLLPLIERAEKKVSRPILDLPVFDPFKPGQANGQ